MKSKKMQRFLPTEFLLLLLALAVFLTPRANAQLYVSAEGSYTVGEYGSSGTIGTVINSSLVPSANNPTQVAVSGSTLYVVNQDSNAIGAYNATTGATINANFISGLDIPNGLAISGTLIYVTNTGNSTVGVYNAITGAAVHANLITGLNNPGYVLVSGSNLFVANSVSTTGTVGVYNAITGAAINAALITGLNYPSGMAMSGTTLLVCSSQSNSIGTYNPVTGAAINGSFITNTDAPATIALSGSTLFVANQPENSVSAYNAITGALINSSFVSGADFCNGITCAAPINVGASPSLDGSASGSGLYSTGDTISVTATANPGYVFSNWSVSGRTVGTLPTYTFAVTGSETVVANFTSAAGTAAIEVLADPIADGTAMGSGTFTVGSQVVISATANAGYTFAGWSDGNSSNPRTITVPSGGAVYVANFVPQTAVVTVEADPVGGGSVLGSGTFAVGSQVQVSATANAGYNFTGWSDGVATNPRTVNVPAAGAAYVANFLPQLAPISIFADPVAGGTAGGSGTFSVGSSIQISATANANWEFTGWDDGVTDNPRTLIVPAGGASYIANFAQTAALDIVASPAYGGSVGGSGTFIVGSFVQISAVAASGYTFTGWNDGVTYPLRLIAIPLGGASYTANFAVAYAPPATPANLLPSPGVLNVSPVVSLHASAFSDPDALATQLASEWIITTASNGNLVDDIVEDTGDMTFLPGLALTGTTNYFWKVRYENSHGIWSQYSPQTIFTTGTHVYRPDEVIGFNPRALIGADVYSSNGTNETLAATLAPARSKTDLVYVQNNGNVIDSFVLNGTGSDANFVVRYYYGLDDVTREILAGTFKLRNLRPGLRRPLREFVAPRATAPFGSVISVALTASSESDPSASDTVVYQVTTP